MRRIGIAVELWSDEARPFIRAGASMACRLAVPWIAIVVCDRAHALSLLTPDQKLRVAENTELVTSLGGLPFFCEGEDIAQALLSATHVTGVELLILGKPRERSPISRILRRQISTAVLRGTGEVSLMFAAYPDGHGASR